MKFLLIFLCVSSISLPLFSAESKNSVWLGTFAKKEVTENYFAWLEAQVRYGFDQGGTNQILYRTGLLRKISKSHQLGFLYAYVQGGNNKEHRITLQHVQQYGNWGSYAFSHRARLEGRFLEDSDDDAGRFRYLIRAGGSKGTQSNLVFWNEVFLNTTRDSWTGDTLFDRNRLFVGMRIKIYNVHGEFGYLNQFVPRDNGDISEHIATIYWFF